MFALVYRACLYLLFCLFFTLVFAFGCAIALVPEVLACKLASLVFCLLFAVEHVHFSKYSFNCIILLSGSFRSVPSANRPGRDPR